MTPMQSRREFTATLSLAGAAALIGSRTTLADEGPPETTTITLLKDPTCGAPITVAEELMHAEGFAEVRFVDFAPGRSTPR